VGLIQDLGRGPVALDTSIFIYFIERHPRFIKLVRELFRQIEGRRLTAVTSAITLLEVLALPFRVGNVVLAERYETLLTRSTGLGLVDLDRRQLRLAAQLRARHAVRPADALQLAAGLSANCTAFVTNDHDLPRVPGIETIVLERYLAA
jgi:predicted nucleic acid-binding protein